MSKVATIERINKIERHPNADSLEILTVGGWRVVAKENQYKEGDLCVYIAPDSIVEDRPIYDFLKKSNFRIKQIKLRGEVSNGLCLPINDALTVHTEDDGIKTVLTNGVFEELREGLDVADLVGAKHYEKELPACLVGKVKSNSLPSFLKKTDEDNLRSYVRALDELKGKQVYISIKMDGSSCTFYKKDGVFGVTSRKVDLLPDESNSFWKMAYQYKIEEKLKNFDNFALQGEVFGPGIQGNKMGAATISFNLFNVWNIAEMKYLGFSDLLAWGNALGLPIVPIIYKGEFNHTLESIIALANEQRYANGNPAEGIVIRPLEETQSLALKGRLSVKVISEIFSAKHGE
jgi:RNA ligase (TIGR02306 family)